MNNIPNGDFLKTNIPTGSFIDTKGNVLPGMDPADYQHLAGLLPPEQAMSVSLRDAVEAGKEEAEKMLDTFVDATKQYIIGAGSDGGIAIDSLGELGENSCEPVQEQGGYDNGYDETKRDGNNKAHRSIAKRKAMNKMAKASKKRNRGK